jgi:hypothetical protein
MSVGRVKIPVVRLGRDDETGLTICGIDTLDGSFAISADLGWDDHISGVVVAEVEHVLAVVIPGVSESLLFADHTVTVC